MHQKFIVDNHLNTTGVYEFYLTCRVIVVVEFLVNVVMVVGQFSGGSVLFSKSVLTSSGSMSHYICNGSGSRDFNK